jgi:class 3 adenylate cyclase/tetratricopeptide (TPR) repeat protein
VLICGACETDNPEGAHFCMGCAAALSAPTVERHRLVTAVFCDLSGSTALGEQVDTEALFGLMRSYFDEARGALERHGGMVEKFIGDAVVGMFGVPDAHEDDALRACRAALEIQERIARLNSGPAARLHTAIAIRVGVNTGEVVAATLGRRELFAGGGAVLGDAVNVAARLEQAAVPGEVLVGEATYRMVRDAVTVEPVPPLLLKGKSAPVAAYRLLSASAAGSVPRRAGAPLVGREAELSLLERDFHAAAEGLCRLVTVVGEPGVGKSRLADEFVESIGLRGRVVRGACLSYGEGITYWAVRQIVRELAGLRDEHSAEQARAQLDAFCSGLADGTAVAAQVATLLGVGEAATTPEELGWALHRFLAVAARDRPLLVVIDDIHWAEPVLLELLARIPEALDRVPVLVLCLARLELVDRDPAWPVTMRLGPLAGSEVDSLLESLDAPATARARIAQAATGNPLFAEELAAWVSAGGDLAEMPTGLNALLGARLDQLAATARDALERGAVEGEVFHYDAVVELSDERARLLVPAGLEELTRKEMISPTAASVAGALLAYRFKHILLREAAYAATAKRLRASLHERFAEWLERRTGDRLAEYEEIVGYHLEQAHRYRAVLGEADVELGLRAGVRLAAAGRRALWRGDESAAANLLGRALTLTRPYTLDVMLELDLSQALWTDPAQAMAVAETAAERAASTADETGAALARAVAALHGLQCGVCSLDELEARVQAARPLVEAGGDHAALAIISWLLGPTVANSRGRYDEWASAAELGLEHARLAGQQRSDRFRIATALAVGPRPADEALRTLDSSLVDTREPWACLRRAELLAMLDRFDEAWLVAQQSRELFRERGGEWGEYALAAVAALAGDRETACRHWQTVCDWLEATRQNAFLASHASLLGLELSHLGRYDEAEARARQSRELGDPDDFVSQALWRQVQALVESQRGNHADAKRLAHEALAYMERTDSLAFQGGALSDLAEVLLAAGRTEEAAAALAQALDRYERKRIIPVARRLRGRLATLEPVRS